LRRLNNGNNNNDYALSPILPASTPNHMNMPTPNFRDSFYQNHPEYVNYDSFMRSFYDTPPATPRSRAPSSVYAPSLGFRNEFNDGKSSSEYSDPFEDDDDLFPPPSSRATSVGSQYSNSYAPSSSAASSSNGSYNSRNGLVDPFYHGAPSSVNSTHSSMPGLMPLPPRALPPRSVGDPDDDDDDDEDEVRNEQLLIANMKDVGIATSNVFLFFKGSIVPIFNTLNRRQVEKINEENESVKEKFKELLSDEFIIMYHIPQVKSLTKSSNDLYTVINNAVTSYVQPRNNGGSLFSSKNGKPIIMHRYYL
jgi:hypothetical protein